MTRGLPVLALAAALAAGGAQAEERPAVGVDAFISSDADETEVSKLGLNLDWRRDGPDHYQGVRLERARFRPLGQAATEDVRVYLRHAHKGRDWAWSGQVGTDGETVLGAVNLHNEARFRQEYFLEREIVETPQGVSRGVYYTFAGAALDLPVGERDTATVVGAVQAFTGRNRRVHLRGSWVHVVQPDWGLSLQLRGRYFHSTRPGEFDYFSPKDFVQVTPTLQLRRRHAGWRYTLAAGLGGQRQTGGGWTSARAFSAELRSPPVARTWALEAAFAWSNTPVGAGYTYEYRQASLGLRRAF